MWVAFRWIRRFAALSVFLVMISINVASLTIASFNALISGALATVSGVQTVAARAQTRAASLAKANTGLTRKLASQTDELTALRKSALSPAHRARAQALMKGVRARTARVAAASVGGMVGEAIPVIGIGVIIAATVYEVDAACDTMKDMTELDTLLAETPDPDAEAEAARICGLEVPTRAEVWNAIRSSPQKAWQAASDAYDGVSEYDWTMPDLGFVEWLTGVVDYWFPQDDTPNALRP